MNKTTLLIVAFLFANYCFSQNALGALKVTTFKNDTDNLADNYIVDTSYVRITNSRYSTDTSVVFIQSQKTKINLKPGRYNLVLSYNNEEEIILNDVLISADKISFVEVLIEPKMALSRKDIRKRKKKYYANY